VGPRSILPQDIAAFEARIRSQLASWWGNDVVSSWKFLKMYCIPYAQPAQDPNLLKLSAAGDDGDDGGDDGSIIAYASTPVVAEDIYT